MKKKIAIILLLVSFAASAFAGIFEFDIGATAQYQVKAESIKMDGLKDVNTGQFLFGPELRVKIAFFQLDTAMLYVPGPKNNPLYKHELSGLITAGVAFDIADIVRIGIGMGPRVLTRWDNNNKIIVLDSNGNTIPMTSDAFSAVGNSTLAYKADIDLLLGSLLIGLDYTVDSSMTFNDPSWKGALPDFKKGKVGITAMFRIGG